MKLIVWLLACVVGILGIVFLVGHQGMILRLVVGSILLLAALALAAMLLLRPKVIKNEIVQRIDLSGDVTPQALVCANCSGQLDKGGLSVKAGAIFVTCPYCHAHYQLEEAPKW